MAEARARLVKTSPTPLELVGRSAAIARVHELVRRAALAEAGVLLVADRGADVTSVAEELHARTRRAAAPFIQVDCASSDPAQLDEWLFGTAPESSSVDLEVVSRDSQMAASFGGTIFLRDVAELPASVQTRLARIARDGEVRIDGQPVGINLRWVASASPGIEGDVQTNRFRGDLYRRLAKSRIDLPPLRDRADDVPALVRRSWPLASHDDAGCARAARGADMGRERGRAPRGG
jgi:DNA-binding NtrC family response regulator